MTTSSHQPDEVTSRVAKQTAKIKCNLFGSDCINGTYDDLANNYTVKIKFDKKPELDSIKDISGSYIGYLDFANYLE